MSAKTAIRLTFALLAIGFFAAPIAARMLGITAEAFENRRFADPPKLSQGWNAFQQTGRFLTDRMPLRAQAVRANTRIWTDVFGATPRYGGGQPALADDGALPFAGAAEQPGQPAPPAAAPDPAQVIRGNDGWLYLQGEQDRACAPAVGVKAALDRWAELVAVVRASGRRAVAVVAPDKASIYPEHLPGDFPNADCAVAGKQALWGVLERSPASAGVVPLRRALLDRKRRGGEQLYLTKDSHWNEQGSLTLVRAALAAVGGGVRVAPAEILDSGTREYTGDLTTLLGESETDVAPVRVVARAADAPRVAGRTLMVRDSYGDAAAPQLAPYVTVFQDALWFGSTAPQLAREVALADTVIFETVEREFAFRAAPDGPVAALTAALRQGLDGRGAR
jgi:alginate O-acetyltransferase complex protein AlgJ